MKRPVLFVALSALLLGCSPESGRAPVQKKENPAENTQVDTQSKTPPPKVQRLTSLQWKTIKKISADTPLSVVYVPFQQDRGKHLADGLVHYLSSCNMTAFGKVIDMIGDEGEGRALRARSELGIAEVTSDMVSSALSAYKSAQKTCGFDFSKKIAKVEKIDSKELMFLYDLRNGKNKSAPPRTTASAGDVANVLFGIAGIVSTVRGGSGNMSVPRGSSGSSSANQGDCVRTCRDGSHVVGTRKGNGQCFFEATCPFG